MKSISLAEGIVGALALATLVVVAVTYRPAERPYTDTFSTYDAGPGGFLAWYRLLEAERIHVTRFEQRTNFLTSEIDALVVANPEQSEAPFDDDALAQWVRGGKTLVWLGRLPAGGPLNLKMHGRTSAMHRLGRGFVFSYADPLPFTNRAIAHDGNDRRAYLAAATAARGGTIAFDEELHGYLNAQNAWDVLPPALRVAFVLVLLAGALALLRGTQRFAPPLLPEPVPERTSAAYIESMAGLLQRAAAAPRAAHDLAETTLRRVSPLAPMYASNADDVAAALGVLKATLRATAHSDGDLVAVADAAVRLRKEVLVDGRGGRRGRRTARRRTP